MNAKTITTSMPFQRDVIFSPLFLHIRIAPTFCIEKWAFDSEIKMEMKHFRINMKCQRVGERIFGCFTYVSTAKRWQRGRGRANEVNRCGKHRNEVCRINEVKSDNAEKWVRNLRRRKFTVNLQHR